jgi:hypothetical protein
MGMISVMPNTGLAIELQPAERTQLEQWESAHGTPQQVALRCRTQRCRRTKVHAFSVRVCRILLRSILEHRLDAGPKPTPASLRASYHPSGSHPPRRLRPLRRYAEEIPGVSVGHKQREDLPGVVDPTVQRQRFLASVIPSVQATKMSLC